MKSIMPTVTTVFADNRPFDWPQYCIKAIYWQVRKKLGHSFITQLGNGAAVKVYPASAYSGIFYSRNPEGSDFRFISENAHLADVFVDVGANVGLFSASLFDKFNKVVCFEPSPSSFRALAETCALNPAVDCELHNLGMGDSSGVLWFENQLDFSTTSRFVEKEGENTIKVPVDTLDHVLGTRFPSLVLKIDVEGYEAKVFGGADRLFGEQRVKLVMFERLGRTNLENVRKFLEERGYVLFRIGEDMKIITDPSAISEPCINLFACPKGLFESISTAR